MDKVPSQWMQAKLRKIINRPFKTHKHNTRARTRAHTHANTHTVSLALNYKKLITDSLLMNIWDKRWHSTGFSSVIAETKQSSQTDGGGKCEWVGARKQDSFITMENTSKIFRQREKGSKIHPILNMNSPPSPLPPAVSTSRSPKSLMKGTLG